MQKTKIEWCDITWSPVVGCRHNCWYCYAKRMNDRFKWLPDWTQPKFYPERLNEPSKLKKPSKIFVCSMSDLFGEWIPKKWIENILIVAGQNRQHTFQFLTKNPKRYLEFEFPENCWLGTTIESAEYGNRMKPFADIKNYKFVSIEPLLSDFTGMNFDRFDLVIVGAMTGKNTIPPKKEWINSIKHRNIFYKNNIKQYL